MSNTQMLAPETAFATVHNRVYAPVFFTKLARDYNIGPRPNTDDAEQMLNMAAQLRVAHEEQVKVASASEGNLLTKAGQHLSSVLNQAGFQIPDSEDQLIKRAAAEVSMDPEIAHAVLSLQAAAYNR